MKANLEYTLPEEAEEYRLAIDGIAWYSVVSGLAEVMRERLRHETLTPDMRMVIEELQKYLYEELDNRKLFLP